MSDTVVIALINTVGLIVVGIGVALINKKQTIISKQINGQQDLLLKVTGEKERAEGKEEGKAEQKKEDIDNHKN